MEIEIAGFAGFVLISIALAKIALERRLDVLHGPYVKGGLENGRSVISLKPRWRSADRALDRLRSLENMRQYQLSSIVS